MFNEEILTKVMLKLIEVGDLLKNKDCDLICLDSRCPFKVNLSNRCFVGVLEEVNENIIQKLNNCK